MNKLLLRESLSKSFDMENYEKLKCAVLAYNKALNQKLDDSDVAAISEVASIAFFYAANVIQKRFELGEKAISKKPSYSYVYSRDVIKGRFELGEPAIAKDANNSYWYAK